MKAIVNNKEYNIRSAKIENGYIELELITVFPSLIEVIRLDLKEHEIEIRE